MKKIIVCENTCMNKNFLTVVSLMGHKPNRPTIINRINKRLQFFNKTIGLHHQYAIDKLTGFQTITVNGKNENFRPENIEIVIQEPGFDTSKVNTASNKIELQVGKVYKLTSGILVKIIAFENDIRFINEPIFIAVGLVDDLVITAQYLKNGKNLSHNNFYCSYDIICEYKEPKKSYLHIQSDGTFHATYNKQVAIDYVKELGGYIKTIIEDGKDEIL